VTGEIATFRHGGLLAMTDSIFVGQDPCGPDYSEVDYYKIIRRTSLLTYDEECRNHRGFDLLRLKIRPYVFGSKTKEIGFVLLYLTSLF